MFLYLDYPVMQLSLVSVTCITNSLSLLRANFFTCRSSESIPVYDTN